MKRLFVAMLLLWPGVAFAQRNILIVTADAADYLLAAGGTIAAMIDGGATAHLIRVSNDPSFAEQNNTEILTGMFSGIGATDSKTLSNPVLGRYVRFIASDFYGFSPGLDDLTILGRTFTSQVFATGSSQLGDSSNFSLLALGQNLPMGYQLLAMDVTGTGGGWSSSTLQVVSVPEPTGILGVAGGLMMMVCRRRT